MVYSRYRYGTVAATTHLDFQFMDASPPADVRSMSVMVTTEQPAGRRNCNDYYSHFKHCPVFIKERRDRLWSGSIGSCQRPAEEEERRDYCKAYWLCVQSK